MAVKLIWDGTGLEPETKETTIIIQDIRNREKRFEVTLEDEIIIGRTKDCQVSLDYDSSVSQKQCMIIKKSGKIYVINLGKTNPTFVNNNKIEQECLLKDGDYLGFGRVDLRIFIRA